MLLGFPNMERGKNMQKTSTRKLVLTAIMIALATVLSLIKVWQMPLGGSVTLLSMLPIAVLSIKYGTKWGLFSAFVYSLAQIGTDLSSLMSWGMTLKIWIGCIIFDYLLAYTMIGLSGVFRKKGDLGICIGVALALILRFVCHIISGTIFFDIWCPDGWSVIPYSICYNGAFMLPELVFTMIATVIIIKVPHIKALLKEE